VWSDQLERGILVGRDDRCSHGGHEEGNLSRVHLVLLSVDDEVWAIDTASTNGTRVNGTRVRRAALLPNDPLSIAHYQFRGFLGPDAPAEVHAEEHTQHLDSREVADLLRQVRGRADKQDHGGKD